MKTARLKSFFCFAVSVVLSASFASAQATVLANDSFSYGPGALSGDNGDTGWAGAWSGSSFASIVDPAIDLIDNRALALSGNNNNAAYRSLASAWSGADLFVSMNLQFSGTLDGNDFASLWFDSSASGAHNNRPNFGIKGNLSGNNDLFVRTSGSAGSAIAGSNLSSGQTVTLMAHLWKSGGGNYDHFDVWLNPLASDLASPDASFTGNTGLSQISMLGFRTTSLDSGDLVLIDNLRLASTWADALPVPEPAPFLMTSAGLFVLLIARRLFSR